MVIRGEVNSDDDDDVDEKCDNWWIFMQTKRTGNEARLEADVCAQIIQPDRKLLPECLFLRLFESPLVIANFNVQKNKIVTTSRALWQRFLKMQSRRSPRLVSNSCVLKSSVPTALQFKPAFQFCSSPFTSNLVFKTKTIDDVRSVASKDSDSDSDDSASDVDSDDVDVDVDDSDDKESYDEVDGDSDVDDGDDSDVVSDDGDSDDGDDGTEIDDVLCEFADDDDEDFDDMDAGD